ncbi:MAG TPA: potassium transporter [Gammaproteobacteria bacterium]|nr:potassium transporter [Gammaproteobacteria bacterium]
MQRLRLIQNLLGLFLLLYSLTLLPPLLVSLLYDDHEAGPFLLSLAITVSLGALMWWPVRTFRREMKTRDGFIVVGLFWLSLGLLSSLPFHFGSHMDMSNAVFEAVSAFTTTGATVLTGLDHMPPSILFYRQQLQWLGGMGVIVLTVAILPMLGVGGMQLYRAETPGPFKDEKIAPRIAHAARSFWMIYSALTLVCALAYWLAGMSLFDAIAHSLSTISTGGFSTHDASLAWFDSPLIEGIAIVFMLLGGINFSIHFIALIQRQPGAYLRDIEVRTYMVYVLLATLLIAGELFRTHYHDDFGTALRYSLFQTTSVITSTGFVTEDFSHWPDFVPVLLFMLSFVGGCGGSTAGGMKVIRFIIMLKQSPRLILQLIHPVLVRPLKLGNRVVPVRVVEAVWGYFSLYVATFVVIMLALMATGLDQVTAFSAVASSMNNLGPGLGEVAANFQGISDTAKWLLALAMLMGRLEIFTVLVLLTPAFWRK